MTSHTQTFHCFLCFTTEILKNIGHSIRVSNKASHTLLRIWSRNRLINVGYSIGLPVNLKSSMGGECCCSCAWSRAIPESVSELLRFAVKTVS